jgi:pyridoxal phosphate enzyme (YggS family)
VLTSDAALRLKQIEDEMARAAREVGRAPEDVRLVAVSKTFGVEEIEPMIAAGQRLFGENRVQEAKAKWPALRARYPDIELHLIGPLQSNKAAEAVALFDCIETIDREKIARAVKAEMASQGKRLRLLVQVNIGDEPQKAGVVSRETSDFVAFCRSELGLDIAGLMCIPPVDADPRPYFLRLQQLAAQLGLKELSMGMSGDFAEAIRCGATSVRVGSALFGARDYGPA